MYGNFVDFAFGNDTTKTAVSRAESDITESDTVQSDITESDIAESDTVQSDMVQSTTTESDMVQSTTTESVRDPITEALAFVEDFDFQVEVFDWENFENDIDFEGMDFSEYL